MLLRSLAFNLWFVVLTTLLAIASLPVRLFAPGRTHAYARLWTRLVLAGLRRLCGIRLVCTGFETLPADGPMLIASEHQSTFETMAWMTLVPRTSYVLKRELMLVPLVGGMLRATGQIPVRRGGGLPAMRDMLRRAEAAAAARRSIVIFPQGTRTAPGAPIRLRGGVAALAAHLNLPVYPVATDAGALWPRRGFLKRPGVVHMSVGAAIPPGLCRDALLAAVAQGWAEAHAAMRAGAPGEAAAVADAAAADAAAALGGPAGPGAQAGADGQAAWVPAASGRSRPGAVDKPVHDLPAAGRITSG